MISFIWPPGELMLPGTGGSETYTAGHVRELLRRGIKAQVVIAGIKAPKSSRGFSGVPFLWLDQVEQVGNLPGKIVFVNNYYPINIKNPTQKVAMIVHNTLPNSLQKPAYHNVDARNITVIATSIYNAQQWSLYLKHPSHKIQVVHPFADPLFNQIKRTRPGRKHRILFAGRLFPDKGIYTLLEALHHQAILQKGKNWSVNIVAAGQQVEPGKVLSRMIQDFPYVKLIPARHTVKAMAKLLACNDILLMPSVYPEPFGMLSVEAQHAGCRVVASNVGSLPGTNCGLLSLVNPRDPDSLIKGVEHAIALGSPTPEERAAAKNFFTLKDSVDALIKVLGS